MLNIKEIYIEHLINPTGLAKMPWFGWIMESDGKNVIQQKYLLELSDDADFGRLLYQSGWVESDNSTHVTVPEVPLASCTRYYVRVKVGDGREESGFSAPASFVTGILAGEEWRAAFITGEKEKDKDCSKGTYLRREITVKAPVKEAFVCATALGLYHFYINGKKAGEDEMAPGWTSYHKHLLYQTYEVTSQLRQGDNALGVMLGAGWYKGEMGFLHLRNNYGTRTAFLMQLVVRYEDGAEEWFVTDEQWQGHDGPVTFSEIYDGECYDARLEIDGWSSPGLDTVGWHKAERIHFPMEALTPQGGCRVRRMEAIPAKRLFQTPSGDMVVDFGQNLTGWPELQISGKSGDVVHVKCFETLDAQGNVYTANLRKARQELRYTCKGGRTLYHPLFTFQGFRYLQILSWPGEPKQEDFTAYPVHSDMEETGSFRCSDPNINQLQHNILWGLKGNFLDVPTDCPQRDERMGWTGDAQIFCRTACYLMNTYTFFRKWLKDVSCDQTPEGGVPHVVPDIISGKEENDWLLSQGTHSAAAWADVAVINPWTMYQTFGDKTILEEQYDSMKKWIGFMQEHSRDNIWNYRLQFGDWVALDAEEGSYFGATPNDLTCTAYYAYSTGLFAKIARVLGKTEDAAYYLALYRRIRDTFQRTFFREDGSMTAMTQTAHIIALYFELVPEKYRKQTAQALVRLLEKENGHLVTGFVGTPYFCHALSRNGYTKEAYELLLKEDFPSWLYQVKMGATTVWEHWDGLKPDGTMWSPDMNSFNHYAYGAVGDWLYRVVLGLEIDEGDPGYHHSVISPRTGDAFSFAEGVYKSVYGPIAIRWDRLDQDTITLKVTIPPNTRSTIILEPGAEPAGQSMATDGPEEICFKLEDGRYAAECGSGNYCVTYRKKS